MMQSTKKQSPNHTLHFHFLEAVGSEFRKSQHGQQLRRDEEGRRDHALHHITYRLLAVHFHSPLRLRVGAGKAVLQEMRNGR